jgi:hypothetical protein
MRRAIAADGLALAFADTNQSLPGADPEAAQERSDAAKFQLLGEAMVFATFVGWQRYGIPQDVACADVAQHMRDMVAARLAKNPSYGALPEAFAQLSEPGRLAVGGVFNYFEDMRSPYEYLSVDSYSLERTIGLTPTDVVNLQSNGVLEGIGPELPVTDYLLSEPYLDYWLARKYGPNQPKTPPQ